MEDRGGLSVDTVATVSALSDNFHTEHGAARCKLKKLTRIRATHREACIVCCHRRGHRAFSPCGSRRAQPPPPSCRGAGGGIKKVCEPSASGLVGRVRGA